MKFAHFKVCLLLAFFFVSAAAWSQTKKITGKVLSEDNKPLTGVSVTLKGKTQGAQTDINGVYSINASEDDLLNFTSVGFESQSIKVGSSSTFDVSLKTSTGKMDEVIVVGYGTQTRKNVTGAIAKLDKEVLATAPRANIGGALQGTVSGLQVVNATGQPGTAPLILLRGGASINSPGAPLVVVDGIIRSFNDIASEDIASIELLKDASATAIYGARANNGVILITTRQGKSGSAQISYKFTSGFNKRRDGYNYLNAHDYIYYNRLGNLNSGIAYNTVNTRRGFGLPVGAGGVTSGTGAADLASFDIKKYDAATMSGLLSQGWDTVGDPYGGTIVFKDHGGELENIVFRNTHTQDHYLNVMGGNEKGKFFSSFDYYKEDGVVIGSGYKRFSADLNGSYKVKPNVEVSTGATFSTSSQLGVNGSEINNLYRNLSLWPTFNPWVDSAKTFPNPGNGINDGNPKYWLGKTDRSNEVNRITANGSVKWDLVPGLYIKGTAAAYLFEQLDQSFDRANQLYSNIFTATQTFNSTTRTSSSTFSRTFQQQYNAIVNYTKTFAVKHNVNAMIGTEYFGTKNSGMRVVGTKAPTDDISTINASTAFAANNSTDINNPNNNYSIKSEYRIISAFGRLNYNYDQRYLLTLVFRQDGVSSLPSKNQSGFFPGISLGWNLDKEDFFKKSGISHVISSIKPRFSYGQNGNVAGLGNYEIQGVYASQGLYNGNGGVLFTGLTNPELRWEKSKTIDWGLDLGVLNNRITVAFDYYNRKTGDLLTNLLLPGYTGFNSFRTNLGEFQNKGYEFTVNANILNQPNGLKVDVGANASFVKNKILHLPNNGQPNNRQGTAAFPLIQVYDPSNPANVLFVGGLQEGGTLGEIYAFKQLSIFKDDAEIAKLAGGRVDKIASITGPGSTYYNGKITAGDVNWQDVNGDDTIDVKDMVRIGNIFPKWTGGFNVNLSYKRFSLYTRFEFALGHTIYNDLVARTLGNYQGTFNYIDWQTKAWSPTNTVTDIPKVYFADQVAGDKQNYTRANNAAANLNGNNSRFYEKGDYLACREVTLSYDFSKSLLSKTKILSQVRAFASLNNLFYITKFSGPSPEPPVLNGAINGVYQGTYPTPRTYVVGVQVSF